MFDLGQSYNFKYFETEEVDATMLYIYQFIINLKPNHAPLGPEQRARGQGSGARC